MREVLKVFGDKQEDMDVQIGRALDLIMAVSDNDKQNNRQKIEKEISEAKEAIDKIAEFT